MLMENGLADRKGRLKPIPGGALPYALANTIFGGTAEYLAVWFTQAAWSRASSGT